MVADSEEIFLCTVRIPSRKIGCYFITHLALDVMIHKKTNEKKLSLIMQPATPKDDWNTTR